jgi:hypothetical protein
VACSKRDPSRDGSATTGQKELPAPDAQTLKRPSDRHAWPVLSCASEAELLALKAGQNVCVRGKALWHHQGAVMCGGLVHVNSPGLSNRFMKALWRLSVRDLATRCPSCEVYALHEEGEGELDICVKVLDPAVGPERSLTATLAAFDDVAVTRIEKQGYYYSGAEPSAPGQSAYILNVEVRATNPTGDL